MIYSSVSARDLAWTPQSESDGHVQRLARSSTVAAFRRGGSCSRCPQPDVVPALHPQRPHGGNEPFGIKPDVFTIESEAVGAMLATHAAIALIADDERLQFQSALASRDIIGQAKGKIMERFNVDAVRAFELLVWICAGLQHPARRSDGGTRFTRTRTDTSKQDERSRSV